MKEKGKRLPSMVKELPIQCVCALRIMTRKFVCSILHCRSMFTASVVLLPLLGLTWAFGILTINNNTTIFAWFFTIFNSLQVSRYLLVFVVTKLSAF